MSTSLNLNVNKPLTFYVRYPDNPDGTVYSLYDILNNKIDESDDNFADLSSYYFAVKNDEIFNGNRLYLDLLSSRTTEFQPNGFNENVTFGGFYNSLYKIETNDE